MTAYDQGKTDFHDGVYNNVYTRYTLNWLEYWSGYRMEEKDFLALVG